MRPPAGLRHDIAFLNRLAEDKTIAAVTQNQALSSLVFLYKHVLEKELASSTGWSGLSDGYDIRTVQKLLGHKDVKTTEISTHVLSLGAGAVLSPADRL